MDREKLNQFILDNCEWQVKGTTHRTTKRSSSHHEENMRWAAKPLLKPCDHCDKMVEGQIIKIKIIGLGTDSPRLEKKCGECGQYIGRHKQLD